VWRALEDLLIKRWPGEFFVSERYETLSPLPIAAGLWLHVFV
jgi:hypothetical protein